MRGLGTDEPFLEEDQMEAIGPHAVSAVWRRPLRIDEIARMAPTAAVRSRPGRP